MRSRLLVATLALCLGGALGPLCQAACALSEATPPGVHAGAADRPCHGAPRGADLEVRSASPAGCSACLRAVSLLGEERLSSPAHPLPLALAASSAPVLARVGTTHPLPILPRARSSPRALFLKHASLLL